MKKLMPLAYGFKTARAAVAMRRWSLCLLVMGCCLPVASQMQVAPVITTVAGNGTAGYSGDNGPATSALITKPEKVAVDAIGNFYFSDPINSVVRKVSTSGIITTVAGNGIAGFSGDNGVATKAELNHPFGVALDNAGNLLIADNGNSRIRKVSTNGIITTIAGTGISGYAGDNGLATNASLFSPGGISIDKSGNVFIADGNNVIRKINTSGIITTVAGTGKYGYTGDNGAATSATFGTLLDVAVDSAGNFYIADQTNSAIRKVNSSGIITTVAGNGTIGYFGDYGAATSAQLYFPFGVAVDASGNLYIADTDNWAIRKVDSSGIITTLVGSPFCTTNKSGLCYYGDNGPATSAGITLPTGLAFDSHGNYYVADWFNNRIRKVSASPTTLGFLDTAIGASSVVQNLLLQTTATETITSISIPQSMGGKQEFTLGTITGCTIGVSNPSGTICTVPITFTPAYPGLRQLPLKVVTSTGNINFGLQGTGVGPQAALTPGIISTVAGIQTCSIIYNQECYSGDNGPATSAEIWQPNGLAVDALGNIFIADTANNAIRKIDTHGIITTVAGSEVNGFAGDNGPATSAWLNTPYGVAVDAIGNIYIADSMSHRIRKVDLNGLITTIAGNGNFGYTGDNIPATSAQLDFPYGVAVDASGNVFIADTMDNRIRKVDSNGIITTVAGSGPGNSIGGYAGDNGPAVSAELNAPQNLTIDALGNLYIADSHNERIRKVDSNGIITTVAGIANIGGYSGDNGPAINAQLAAYSVAVDAIGNIYIAGRQGGRIRKVDTSGIITTVAGNGVSGYSGDNGPATIAEVGWASGIAVDASGNLYIADSFNSRIRKVTVNQSALSYPTATPVGSADSADGPQKFTLSNIGNAALSLATPSTGNNPSIATGFAYDAASGCPQLGTASSAYSLAAGASCSYAVDFIPTVSGTNSGSLILTDNSLNATGTTQMVALNGTGKGATALLTPVLSYTITPQPYAPGQVESVAITVSGGASGITPTGTVSITSPATGTSPAALDTAGYATILAQLPVGQLCYNTPIGVHYSGDGNFAAADTLMNALMVGCTSATALTVSPTNASVGQTITMTATATGIFAAQPTLGTVTFLNGSTVIGTAYIDASGLASLTTSTLAAGIYSLTAQYSGESNDFGSTSAAVTANITATPSATGLNFPDTPVGQTSAVQTGTLTIPGNVSVQNMTITTTQGGKFEFVLKSNSCSYNGSTATVCTVLLTFSPSYPGLRWVPLVVLTSIGDVNFGMIGIGLGPQTALTPGILSTVAGNGSAGYSGDGAGATGAQINPSYSIAVDYMGNLYIPDSVNNRIRKVDIAGKITTIAGNGTQGNTGDNGPAISAEIYPPSSIALDSAGDLYFAEGTLNTIRKVDSNGVITTVAGNTTNGYTGNGGQATIAELNNPNGVAVDRLGNLYLADTGNNVIRKVDTAGIITTIAGTGTQGYSGDGGQAINATFNIPRGIALDSAGNLYIADEANNVIRKVNTSGVITTVAGNGTGGYTGDGGLATSAEIYNPFAVTVDSAGNIYIADLVNNVIRKVNASGIITTVAGNGKQSYSGNGGDATAGAFSFPTGIALDNPGNLYITDSFNHRIRMVDVSTSAMNWPTATPVGTKDTKDGARSVRVSNIGNTALSITVPSSGTNPSIPSGFAYDPASTCPQLSTTGSVFSLASGTDCNYEVDFTPTATGANFGKLLLSDNTLNTASTQQVSLNGIGSQIATTTTLVATPTPVPYGQNLTLTATVTPLTGTGTPTGTVTYSIGAAQIGTGTLNASGVSTIAYSTLPVGTSCVVATYSGDVNFATSTSSPCTSVTVNPIATTTTLSASASSLVVGQSLTLTATVTPASGTTPGGAVTFNSGTTLLGSGTLNSSGVAMLTLTPAVGSYSIIASYLGSATDAPSSSAAVPVTVLPPRDFTLTASPASQSVYTVQAPHYTLTITPIGSFNLPVTFTCTGAPTNTSCSFSPATVNGAGSTTLSVQTTAPGPVAAARMSSGAHSSRYRFVAVCSLLLFLLPLRLRKMAGSRVMLILLALVMLGASMTGCTTQGKLGGGTAVGSYQITVVASANNGTTPLTHSTTVTLNVESLY